MSLFTCVRQNAQAHEDETNGEVDHFRPKAHFPESVYEWSNWVLACHDCNNPKNVHWPRFGFVNPCSKRDKPENYFDFDLLTGEILPKASLKIQCKRKALDTIGHLRLNGFHQLKRRRNWISIFTFLINQGNRNQKQYRLFVKQMTARETALSSLSRAILKHNGV